MYSLMFAFASGKIRQVLVIRCQYPREISSHLHNELLNAVSGQFTTQYRTFEHYSTLLSGGHLHNDLLNAQLKAGQKRLST